MDCIYIPFGIAGNYLRLSGENILICGKSFYYVFDTVNRRFDKVIVNSGDLGYSSLITKDNMAFHHDGGIYYYSIQDKMQQKLYDLKGKELFIMYGNTTWSILITADNIKKSLANDTCFDLIAIKTRK
jgi:uncharacterized secreted protein with C-terminal beta-propeller domain